MDAISIQSFKISKPIEELNGQSYSILLFTNIFTAFIAIHAEIYYVLERMTLNE